MKNIKLGNDIIPVGQFKAGLAKHLKKVQTKLFIDSISRGLTDSEKREVLTTAQLRTELKNARGNK